MRRMLAFSLVVLICVGFAGFASPAIPPAEAAVNLPPRPTLTPTPENLTRILLVGGSAYEGAWAVVQWQDKRGDWHDVEGWQGHIRNGWIRWRVDAKDWGTGPFRWLVYDKPDGALLATTTPFSLPGGRYGLLWLTPTPVPAQ